MHWVLQDNIFSEQGWNVLVETLQRFNIPFSEHKVVPFIGELLPDPEPIEGPVICIGSYSMRHIAKKKGWNPGVFDLEPQNFLVQKKHWGELMLNYDSMVLPFKDVYLDEPRFVRPIDDSKYFAGKVFDPDEFNRWRVSIVDLKQETGISLTPETLVQICKPHKIYSENRFWIVDGKIVTASTYKIGHRVAYSPDVDTKFYDFVRQLFDPFLQREGRPWLPHEAFVIDVCDTPEGIKIVEINTLNSSGFYAGDVQKLVFALEEKFA
jgi:hypothetical protein